MTPIDSRNRLSTPFSPRIVVHEVDPQQVARPERQDDQHAAAAAAGPARTYRASQYANGNAASSVSAVATAATQTVSHSVVTYVGVLKK